MTGSESLTPSSPQTDPAQLVTVLRECETAAALHVSRCRSELEFDLVHYYEGRRDAFAEVIRHIEHPEDSE